MSPRWPPSPPRPTSGWSRSPIPTPAGASGSPASPVTPASGPWPPSRTPPRCSPAQTSTRWSWRRPPPLTWPTPSGPALTPPPFVGFNRRFDAGARAVRRALPAGGSVDLYLEISYRRRSWGAHAVHDDALVDLGPHLVDWARWISGREVVEVACTELRGDRVALDLVLSGDGGGDDRGPGRATVRAATDRPHAELVELRDGAGDLLARHRLGGLASGLRGRLGRRGPDALVASLAGQLVAFAAAVRGEAPPDLGTAADGHAAMTVIDAARTSAADGARPVPIPRPVEA